MHTFQVEVSDQLLHDKMSFVLPTELVNTFIKSTSKGPLNITVKIIKKNDFKYTDLERSYNYTRSLVNIIQGLASTSKMLYIREVHRVTKCIHQIRHEQSKWANIRTGHVVMLLRYIPVLIISSVAWCLIFMEIIGLKQVFAIFNDHTMQQLRLFLSSQTVYR